VDVGRCWLVACAALVAGALPAGSAASVSRAGRVSAAPLCTDFAATGDYQGPGAITPSIGTTKLTFSCSGDAGTSPGGTPWGMTLKLSSSPLAVNPCYTPYMYEGTGSSPTTVFLAGSYYVLFQYGGCGQGQNTSSCGVKVDASLILNKVGSTGQPDDVTIGQASVVAGCHTTPGATVASSTAAPASASAPTAGAAGLAAAKTAVADAELFLGRAVTDYKRYESLHDTVQRYMSARISAELDDLLEREEAALDAALKAAPKTGLSEFERAEIIRRVESARTASRTVMLDLDHPDAQGLDELEHAQLELRPLEQVM
jgi:hypothetical protein